MKERIGNMTVTYRDVTTSFGDGEQVTPGDVQLAGEVSHLANEKGRVNSILHANAHLYTHI